MNPPLIQPIEEVQDKLVVTLPNGGESKSAAQLIAALDFGSAQYLLDYDITTVGRSEDNMIRVESVDVSEHHAEIFRTSAGFVLRDLGSTKGTWIGTLRIDGDAFLGDQDVIRFGGVTARFVTDNPNR